MEMSCFSRRLAKSSKLSFRIILSIIVPSIGLLIVTSYIAVERLNKTQQADQLMNATIIIPLVNRLTHEIQKERGISVGYAGNQGRRFVNELALQRGFTDAARKELETRISSTLIQPATHHYLERLSLQVSLVEKLQGFREQVDHFDVSEKDIIRHYNSIIDNFYKISGKHTQDSFATLTLSYIFFAQAKDWVGRERALGASGLHDGQINLHTRHQISALIAQQELLFNQFTEYALRDHVVKLEAMRQSPEFIQVNKLQQLFESGNAGTALTIEPEEWFRVFTAKIDLLEQLEGSIADQLVAKAENIEKQAYKELYIITSVFLLLLLVSLFMVYLISHSILKPLATITSNMNVLSAGNTSIEIDTKQGIKEFVALNKALEVFRSSIVDLKRTAQRLQLATEISQLGVWEYDIPEDKLYWDKKTFEIFDIKPEGEHISNETWKQLVHPEDINSLQKETIKAIRNDTDIDLQYRIVKEDNSIGYIRTLAILDNNSHTKTDHLIGVCIDVTEEREARNRLENINTELDAKIKERTAELEASKNIAKRREKEAINANLAKTEFLNTMTHEIRTPLNSVIGMAYLALKQNLDSKSKNYIEKIHVSGNHLLGLVNDLLDISKIEADMFEIEHGVFNIDEIKERLNTVFNTDVRDKNINFSVKFSSDIPQYLLGDFQRLSQILINLVANAFKFTEQGKILVEVNLVSEKENRCDICFCVSDTGIGIDKEKLEMLFLPFSQVNSDIGKSYGGTGLGLVISKKLVELMGGTVDIESKIGIGTTYKVIIPFDIQCQGNEQDSLIADNNAQAIDLSGMKILMAEDNIFNQELGVDLLKEVGAEVTIAQNGREAVELINKSRFDCVLMDIQMPEMNGLDATRLIRQKGNSLPIIALTANASTTEKNRCLEAGMDDFVTKPISPKLLYSVILDAVNQSRKTE